MSKLEDITKGYNSRTPGRHLEPEKGNVALGTILTLAAMPVSAYLCSYVGEGAGWLTGNIVDFIPYARDVAPWIAERTGLIGDVANTANLNEDLYQTAGSVSSFWAGLWLPVRVAAELALRR